MGACCACQPPQSARQHINKASLYQQKFDHKEQNLQSALPHKEQIESQGINPIINDLYRAPLPTNMLSIIIRTISSLEFEINVDKNMTGGQLKTYIYQNICQSLSEPNMSIFYGDTLIRNNKRLAELRIVTGTKLLIRQAKLAINQAENNNAQVYGIDPFSDEVGTYKMSCGHSIGTDTMTAMVRSLISCKQSEIRCPQLNENGQLCQALWDFKTCKQIGRFTQEEIREFQQGLSLNWIRENCKKCPNLNCCQVIYKTDCKSNRVRCPVCKAYDFCYFCLNKWTSNNQQFCGNEDGCNIINRFLETSPWNLKFRLRDTSNTVRTYYGPQYRACPRCSVVIEYGHSPGSKHMRCQSCKKQFCWICLSLQEKPDSQWSCGYDFDYCGKIAPVQQLAPT